MRVLIVNWVDHLDRQGRGGGVAVYQRNLVAALRARGGVEVTTLASGLVHGFRAGPPRVVPLGGAGSGRFQMVDSGVLAPAHADFGNPAQIDHPATAAAMAEFLAATGPYDAIHFDNLEGLPASVLALGRAWPRTRVVLTLHNYYPFCPQVNLWQDEVRACTDDRGGAACATCLPLRPDRRVIRAAYALESQAERLGLGPGTLAFDRGIHPAIRLGWRSLRALRGRPPGAPVPAPSPEPSPDPSTAPAPDGRPAAMTQAGSDGAAFAARRAAMVDLINRHCDQVLCVSDRVRQIATGYGIRPDLALTCPIGTPQARAWTRTHPRPRFLADDGTLRLAYLGYMRRDKGFGFLLQALAALPRATAARLHLTVAARTGPPEMMAALAALAPRLASLTHHQGYGHDDLDRLLDGVDLGLVPVLWEDNLPQVAIEMHARHIPLLCSDLGGARELANCPDLVFRAGDLADFARALDRVLSGNLSPADCFHNARPPTDPDRHLAALLAHWGGTAPT